MAVNIVQPETQIRGSRGREGSSRKGQIAGLLAGGALAAAALPTGGLTAPAAAAALGTTLGGAQLGGMVGGAIDSGRPDTRQAIERRVQGMGQQTSQVNPQKTLQDAIFALRESNDPELIKQYAPPLTQALVKTSFA